jgi:hypothetical protein
MDVRRVDEAIRRDVSLPMSFDFRLPKIRMKCRQVVKYRCQYLQGDVYQPVARIPVE